MGGYTESNLLGRKLGNREIKDLGGGRSRIALNPELKARELFLCCLKGRDAETHVHNP